MAFSASNLLNLDQVIDPSPLILAPDQSVVEAIARMSQFRERIPPPQNHSTAKPYQGGLSAGCTLVVKESYLVGIFTEQDVVRLVATGQCLQDLTMAEVMMRSPLTWKASQGQSLETLLTLFRQHQISYLPVVNDHDQVLGLISQASLLQGIDVNQDQLVDWQGVEPNLLGEGRDMTERKQAESALQEAYEQLEMRVEQRTAQLSTANQQLQIEITERQRVEEELRERSAKIRALYEVTSDQELDFYERLQNMLATVCQQFKLNYGSVTCIQGDRCELIATYASDNAINRGDVLNLQNTFCVETLKQSEPLIIDHTSNSEWKDHPVCRISRLETYMGNRLVVGNHVYGTLCFCDTLPAPRPFKELDRELLMLVTQWVEGEIERQQAEWALRESEARLRLALKAAQMETWDWNVLTDQTLLSEHIGQLLGLSPNTKQPHSYELFLDAIYPADQESVKQAIAAALEQGTDYRAEFRVLWPDGTLHWLGDRGQVYHNSEGKPTRMIGVIMDITDRKQIEEEICKALEKERELNQLKSRFISMASHEFRTPLAIISSSTGILEDYSHRLPEEKKQEHLRRIQITVKRMTQLLDDVLMINRAEAEKLEFNPQRLNLAEMCQNVVDEMQSNAHQHQIVFSLPRNQDTAFHNCCIDQKLVWQILTNLLSNAIKYSPKGDTIQFQLTLQDHHAVFQIQDQGIGIPLEDQAQLFESFHRAKNVGAIPGTGLGLAIVKRCIDLHQGTIVVASQCDIGTTFTVRLPVTTQPALTLNSSPSLGEEL